MQDHEYPSGHKITTAKQQKLLDALAVAGRYGLTPREQAQNEGEDVSGVNGWGGVFTVLRQRGYIKGLTQMRESHHVYVLPEHLHGRETWAGYRHKGTVIETVIIVKHCETCTCEEH